MTDNGPDGASAMIVVDDNGFRRDPLPVAFAAGRYGEVTLETFAELDENRPEQVGLVLAPDADVAALQPLLSRIDLIKVPFDNFSDGRGFSLAVRLRRAGYAGRLRAFGHVIADQYAHARRCGFDEVAITTAQAKRQPEAQWRAEVPKINNSYQIRLQQAAQAA